MLGNYHVYISKVFNPTLYIFCINMQNKQTNYISIVNHELPEPFTVLRHSIALLSGSTLDYGLSTYPTHASYPGVREFPLQINIVFSYISDRQEGADPGNPLYDIDPFEKTT